MDDKRPVPVIVFLFFILGAAYPLRTCLADSSGSTDNDGTQKTYYWQGTQLNNLSRLGNTADFEEEQRRAGEGKDADRYLTSIREQMAHQTQADAQEKTSLVFHGQLPGDPIELTYLSPGVRVTLHANALFDENSAMMKKGSIDIMERLRTILETEVQTPLQFVMADTLDDVPEAKNLDAERSLVVLSMLQIPENHDDQENMSPEVLAR